jgi:hypothetical protein
MTEARSLSIFTIESDRKPVPVSLPIAQTAKGALSIFHRAQ